MNSVTDKFDVDFCGEGEEYDDTSVAKFVFFFLLGIENRKSHLFLKITFSLDDQSVAFKTNPLRRKEKRVASWNDNVTVRTQPYPVQMRSSSIPNHECLRMGSCARKRKVSSQEKLCPVSPDINKPWMRTMNSAEYKRAKLSNGSTFRVYTNPGSYVSLDSKRFKIQRA